MSCGFYLLYNYNPSVNKVDTVFDPGRKYNLCPALAKNMSLAYFLYASRLTQWSLFEVTQYNAVNKPFIQFLLRFRRLQVYLKTRRYIRLKPIQF